MDLIEFGEFFKEHRIKSGYSSQRKLALASGISNGTIARIEAGTQKATPETLSKLSEYLTSTTNDELMVKVGYIEEANSIIQKEIDSTLDFLFNVITENGTFKNEVVERNVKKLTEKFSVMFDEEEEITPESIRKALSENYDLYLKGDFIASLYDILKDSVDPNHENELFYFLSKPNITFQGRTFTEEDKVLTINFLDALFHGRKNEYDRKEKE